MTFEPVHLPADKGLERKASQTFLRHYNSCPRSAFLYQSNKGRGVQTHAMVRGSALHTVLERCTKALVEHEEERIPPELAKAILGEVLIETHVPVEEHDYLREMCFRWAGEWRIPLDTRVVACETLFVLEVAGWIVRCKVDYACLTEHGIYIADLKSGRGAVSMDDVARKRTDGSFAVKNLQLILYALAVMFGVPVIEREYGPGETVFFDAEGGLPPLKPDPIIGSPVAPGCNEAVMEFVYPGIEDSEGLMLRRTMSLTRPEALEYLESLEALLARVAESEESGDWPAMLSDTGCGECPAPQLCPIPEELRDYRGSINTHEQAATAAERRYVRRKLDEALGRELKAWSKANGSPIRFGKDRVLDFTLMESERLTNKEALLAGEETIPVFRTVKSTPFSERALTEEEIDGR